MISNYIKIALRNMARHKVYTVINVAGLAVGMALVFLLLLFVRGQVSYGRHNSRYDRIYMVQTHFRQGERDNIYIGSSLPIGGVAAILALALTLALAPVFLFLTERTST